jgi:dTDP-4-dehydrorhamnose 3,5-epimerase
VIFTPTDIEGAWQIDLAPQHDERGFFARSFCAETFAAHGLCTAFPQCNISYNRSAGTLRGLHGTRPSHPEAKLVRCTSGRIWDVSVDARPASPSFGRWHAIELSAAGHRMVFIPAGCLHGFLTLSPDAEVFYQMSVPHQPASDIGVRWNDAELAILWPDTPTMVSPRDAGLPAWKEITAMLGETS